MNKAQKQVQQAFLDSEKAILKNLERNYKDAILEIETRLAILKGRSDANLSNVIYQIQYQEQLKHQVEVILKNLQEKNYSSLNEYLNNSYVDGFLGTMYDLQKQGIPLVIPIDQNQVVAAVQHETKLSEGLYAALGKDTRILSRQIAGEISRGISNGAMYSEIARNIAGYSNIPMNNAMRIARTEAHRIQCKATADAQWKAKEKGADIVKQWDASLDGKTRDSHRKLDGQIRELDEPFEVDGMTAMEPGGFGDPSEDCNCRCALLQRARWALGDEYTKWSPDAPELISDSGTTQLVKVEAKDFNEFKGFYKDITGQMTMNLENSGSKSVRSSVPKMKSLEKSGNGDTIKLKDTQIYRSVGAKARNYEIIDKSTGEKFKFVEGTKIQNSEAFAGKGTKHSLHEGVAEGLTKEFGGSPEKWQHCKGIGVIDHYGENIKAEVHWFQEETVGKVKFKVKEWLDES